MGLKQRVEKIEQAAQEALAGEKWDRHAALRFERDLHKVYGAPGTDEPTLDDIPATKEEWDAEWEAALAKAYGPATEV